MGSFSLSSTSIRGYEINRVSRKIPRNWQRTHPYFPGIGSVIDDIDKVSPILFGRGSKLT